MGTKLHAYGEAILNVYKEKSDEDKPDISFIPVPDSPKAIWVPQIVHRLVKEEGYEVAKTELLLYSLATKISGQSDIFLRKGYVDGDTAVNKVMAKKKFPRHVEYNYMIYDWKFLQDKIKKKGFYNVRTRKYKTMLGPFKYLDDCNWIHYSIQLAIYQALSGAPERITEKVLIAVTDDGYEFVPAYPMFVYWDEEGNIQAVYETWGGKWYISEYDQLVVDKPEWLPAI